MLLLPRTDPRDPACRLTTKVTHNDASEAAPERVAVGELRLIGPRVD